MYQDEKQLRMNLYLLIYQWNKIQTIKDPIKQEKYNNKLHDWITQVQFKIAEIELKQKVG